MELDVAVLLVPADPRQEAVEVSILRLLVRSGLHTHTMPDPIILSDNESANIESETDYSNLKVDLTTKSDYFSPHIAGNDIADGEGFVSRTTHISDLIVAGHQDDDNDSGVVDGATLQLPADLPISVSPGHGFFTPSQPLAGE